MKTTILDGGWVIVHAENAALIELTAAKELAYFIGKATGRTPEIICECRYRSGRAILVNTRNIAFAAKDEYEAFDAGEEGVFYSVEENLVFIGGGNVRGVLYSAYTFIEEELGCHRYTEELEVIPKAESLELTCKTYSFIPPMHYRACSFRDGEAQDYAVFNKLNARSRIGAEYGGGFEFGIGFVHTLPGLIPDSLFDSHPEYFPLIDGERRKGPGHQRCLNNPNELAMTIEKVRADFRAHPDHKTASVSQADTGEVPFCCTCPECSRINEEEGSLMGTQLRFVNAVADAIKDEFPDRYIETLAYRFTRHVTKITKPRDNVIIRLCSIECCFSHPIDECQHGNPAFVKDMCDWAACAKNIYIWDYVTNFLHYLAPQPNIGVLGPNMKFFVEHNTVGMFPEGAPDARGSELSELKSWLLAKLEWDPDFDTVKGTKEFISAFAGKGAPYIQSYVDRLTKRPEITGSHRGCYAQPDTDFFDGGFMKSAKEDFAAAKDAAENDEVLARICRWEMYIRYIDLILYPDQYTVEQLRAMVGEYVADMKKYGISKVHEGGTYESSADVLAARIRARMPEFTL